MMGALVLTTPVLAQGGRAGDGGNGGGDAAQPAPSQRAGHIPNDFTDASLDAPLLETKHVYDLYGAIVGYLLQVYPQDGPAHDALTKFNQFVQHEKSAYEADPASARPYRMPMSIDSLMKYLNQGATGDSSPATLGIEDNIKAQLYVSSILPLIHLRGITFRVRPMVERSFVMHSMGINFLRGLKQQLDVMSGANGRAVFNFMTFPMSYSERTKLQFDTVSDFQSWLISSFLPTLNHSITIVERAVASSGDDFKASLNMQVFMKADHPFPSAAMESAHRWFGSEEVKVYLGQLYAARAGLRLFCAYDLDDYGKATNELSSTLIKDFFKEKVRFGKKPRVGTPSHRRFKIMEKYSKLWTLKSSEQCQAALGDIQKASAVYDQAMHGFFKASSGDGDNRLAVIRYFHSSYREYETKLAPQIRAVVSGPATLTDYIGGATVDVDLPGFLSNPPQDLKAFFPEKFDTTAKYVELESASDTLVYTNYDYGRPLGWKAGAAADSWGKIFPNIKKSVNSDGYWDAPLVTFRDLSRTYVGMLVAPLLSGAIF